MIRHLLPSLGFTIVAIASFSVWAFGGKWFASVWSLYTACTVIFFIFGGLALLPYSGGTAARPKWKLLWLFPLSFLVYSIFWCAGWFTFKSHFGEIWGSALGILGMTLVLKRGLKFSRPILEAALVVFGIYTLGYYLGEKAYHEISGLWGKLLWGAGFGLGMGTGLAYLVQLARSKN
jgi:hypothetical protein